MLETALTKKLGIKYPIIAGTMMHISKPDFVAACSNAGTLGILASAIYKDPESLRNAIRRIKTLTDKPFGVNINLFPMLQPVNQRDFIQVMVDERVPVLETSGHRAPEDLVPLLREGGATWIHKCAGVRYAIKGAELGADIIEVVGWENGGATGPLDIGVMVLVPSTVDAVRVPVVAGGGISDGRGLVAALALGAVGVVIGTRMMATVECPIHENLKRALVDAAHTDTVLVMRSLHATHRVWNNAAARRILEIEAEKGKPEDIFPIAAGKNALRMYEEGDLDAGIVSCGQGVGLVKDIPTVHDLVARIMDEAEAAMEKLTGSHS